MRSIGQPNSIVRQVDFWDRSYEGRRLFAEALGTFFLVFVAAGGGIVSARFGGQAVPYAARATAPGLMVMAVILFTGALSGAHLNPAVSIAFALRGDFPRRRVPGYAAAQFLGAVLAMLALWALIGKHGSAGLTLPGSGVSAGHRADLGNGAGNGPGQRHPRHRVRRAAGRPAGRHRRERLHRARGTGRRAGQRCLDEPGPVTWACSRDGDWTAWWAYLAGPVAGGMIAVGIARVLRGPSGDPSAIRAAQGTLSAPGSSITENGGGETAVPHGAGTGSAEPGTLGD